LNVFDELQSGAVYGETVDDAITIANEAIELYIERLVVHNGPVPDE
jgi:predicted RNase H-like HicB family nuclease